MGNEPSLSTLVSKCGLKDMQVTYFEADEWLVYFSRGTRWCGKLLTQMFQRRIKLFVAYGSDTKK